MSDAAQRPGVAALALGFVAALGAALMLYGPALRGPFVSDDLHYVSQNERVHTLSLENFAAIVDPTGDVAIDIVNYAPVQMLVHALAWQLFGDETLGHHVLNVVLHTVSAALLAWLLFANGVPRAGAALAGAAFLVHPANVEAVAWISQLKSTLALALALGALLALPKRAVLSTCLFAAALLAKPTAVCVLPAAALLEWSRTGRVRVPWVAAWAVCFAIFAVIEFSTHQRTGAAETGLYDVPLVLMRTVFALAARYVVLAASGWRSSAFHEPEPATSVLDGWWLLALPLAGFALWRLRGGLRSRSPGAAYWLWAAVAFAPVSQVFPFLYPFADRYLYFILPGLLGAGLCAGGQLFSGWPAARRASLGRGALLAGAAWVVLLAVQTPGRAAIWRSNTALLVDASTHYPDGKVANVLRAKRAAQRGDAEATVAALRRAAARGFNRFEQLETDPSYVRVRDATAFRALVSELALRWIESGRGKADRTPSERRSIAHAHIARGELAEAIAELEPAIAVGGPYTEDLRAELDAIRAALAAGAPDRVRLRISAPR